MTEAQATNLQEKRRKTEAKALTSIEIGDSQEEWVVDLLNKTGKFLKVERIGQQNSKSDIIVTYFDNTKFHLQVKTLSLTIQGTLQHYELDLRKTYPSDMLILMLSRDKSILAMEFYKNIATQSMSFHLGASCLYKKMMFKIPLEFGYAIAEKAKMSEPFRSRLDFLSPTFVKEQMMKERLALICQAHGLDFKENSTSGNAVDGFINGKSVQLKFTSHHPSKNTFGVTTQKHGIHMNGKNFQVPYDDDDFDALVVEVGSADGKSLYESQFCIIPKSELIAKKVLHTAEDVGKKNIGISKPDAKKPHWSLKWWNNWKMFTSE